MGMPMELNTMIVTKGREEREEENIFRLKKKGIVYTQSIFHSISVRRSKVNQAELRSSKK